MILKSSDIAKKLRREENFDDPLVITPMPDLESMDQFSTASVDLRLGSWFLSFKKSNSTVIDVQNHISDNHSDSRWVREHYIPFGKPYVLHPSDFVLGVTLEWIRMPKNLSAYVIGKSSWGRRGLIIATATGVHPNFSGCLTLEITNLGEIPIKIYPGMCMCQLFIHETTEYDKGEVSSFAGNRKPSVGSIKFDKVFESLKSN